MKARKIKLSNQAIRKEIDFTNQAIYCGLDVHLKNWMVTVIINNIIVERFSMNPNPKELVNHLRRNYPNGVYYTVYEAGFSGVWAHRILEQFGVNSIICNPGDVPTRNKERRKKTDKIDSGKLARELSNGNLDGIYIPTEEQEAIRVLARLRKQFTNDQTRTKNRIKSLLNFLGIRTESEDEAIKHWSGKYIKYLETIEFRQIELKDAMNSSLDRLRSDRKQITDVTRALRKYVRGNEHCRKLIKRLMSVPGIGFITAITLFTEIMDIKRFRKLDNLCSLIGFVPDSEATGEREKVKGISRQHNRYLRNMLIESAWVAIRKDNALMMAYGKLIRKMTSQRAIIRIAKKLLNRIMFVWRNDCDYISGVVS